VTSLRKGTTLLTLAPERVPSGFIADLVARGVRVALGHSMATYVETKQALAEGMTGFTHLFNAMRPIESREPGPIAAALEATPAWFGMIVDGSHVHPSVLRMALRGSSAPMIVTDAMPPVGGISTNFILDGRTISVRGASCVREDGVLAGSALDMASAVRSTVNLLGVSLASALRYASTEPARILAIDGEIGRLAPGLRADMVALEPAGVRVLGTWLAGQWAPSP
jgi:N-acetylglucosamine-6-phosphate deacetylase